MSDRINHTGACASDNFSCGQCQPHIIHRVIILVTGGSGFIGSHMALSLLRSGHKVLSVDKVEPPDILVHNQFSHIQADLNDPNTVRALFAKYNFDAVMHFASLIQAGESTKVPLSYYRTNVAATLTLLETMVDHDVNRLIFSSSAAVYGEPSYVPIDESHPRSPVNPYGRSKMIIEDILSDLRQSCGMHSVALRYFNAAGASPHDGLFERHDPETHLIPLAIRAATFADYALNVYGADYATKDGTCIRDFVHVRDLCDAHMLALEYLMDDGSLFAFNLGNQNGFSVLEVIRTTEEVLGRPVKYEIQGRRPGDPAVLIADSTLARSELGWSPRFSELEMMIADGAGTIV